MGLRKQDNRRCEDVRGHGTLRRSSLDISRRSDTAEGNPAPLSPRSSKSLALCSSHTWVNHQTAPQSIGKACPAKMSRATWWCKDDYVFRKVINEGGGCRMYQAICKTSGMPVTLQCHDKSCLDEQQIKRIQREVELRSRLNHRHILNLYGAFEDQRWYYLVQEAADESLAKDFASRRDQIMEKEVVTRVVLPVLMAVDYLHSMGMVHGQVSPRSVFLATNEQGLQIAKLANFRMLWVPQEESCIRPDPGILEYASPEILMSPWLAAERLHDSVSQAGICSSIDGKADVWSVAVLAFEALFRFSVFAHDSNNRQDIVTSILTEEPYFYPEIRALSCWAKDYISSCLNKVSTARPAARALISHPWIRKKDPRKESVDFLRASEPANDVTFLPRPSRKSIDLPQLVTPHHSGTLHKSECYPLNPPATKNTGSHATRNVQSIQGVMPDSFAMASPRHLNIIRTNCPMQTQQVSCSCSGTDGPISKQYASFPREGKHASIEKFSTKLPAGLVDSFATSAPSRLIQPCQQMGQTAISESNAKQNTLLPQFAPDGVKESNSNSYNVLFTDSAVSHAAGKQTFAGRHKVSMASDDHIRQTQPPSSENHDWRNHDWAKHEWKVMPAAEQLRGSTSPRRKSINVIRNSFSPSS